MLWAAAQLDAVTIKIMNESGKKPHKETKHTTASPSLILIYRWSALMDDARQAEVILVSDQLSLIRCFCIVPDVWPAVQGQKRTEREKAKSTNTQHGDLNYHRPWQADRFPYSQSPLLVPKRCLLNVRAQVEKALRAGVKVKVKKWVFKCRLFAACSAGDDLMRCVDLYNQTQSKWFEEMVTTSMVRT